MKVNHGLTKKDKRKLRVRAKVQGTTQRPRLHVFRSNKGMYLQVIDDVQGKTIASANTKNVKVKGTKLEKARQVAEELATQLKDAKVSKLVFDRGSYRFHGRVRVIAEVMREKGLEV